MAEPLIDQRVAEIASDLKVRGRYRQRVLAELRSHLEDATERHELEGLEHSDAVDAAVKHLGGSEAIIAGLQPRQTRQTRVLAAVPIAGAAMAVGSLRAANLLHERGGRLWSSPMYTAVWVIGWLSILLLCSALVALFVRHRGVLGRTGAVAAAFVLLSAGTLLACHFSNDGSFDRGDPDMWRGLAIVCGLVLVAALGATIRRAGLVPLRPVGLASIGLVLVAADYSVIDGEALGLTGLGLLVAAGCDLTLVLVRRRPLA